MVANLTILNHGGECCGIKTVAGFGYGPSCVTDSVPSITKADKLNNLDAQGQPVSSDRPFFTDAAPCESRRDRLVRLIAFMKKRRPCNLLEAVLAESSAGWADQYRYWKPVLEELGFVETISHLNSNSGNVCHVFYLKIDEDYPGKDDGDPDDCEDDYDEDDDDYNED